VVLTFSAVACSPETPGTPDVVGTTPAPEQPAPAEEPTPTPLAEIEISLELVAEGLEQPLFVTGAGDGSGRLFVLEKTGRAWILRDGERLATPFLDLSDTVSTSSEQGLLGMAFSPSFAKDGVLYVGYTDAKGTSTISRFTARGDAVDAASEQVLLRVAQPYANHNGGMLAFGPDGYLYIGFGDGGSGGDPQGNGQNPNALLGKMLRIDVSPDAATSPDRAYGVPADNPMLAGGTAAPEIWASGLRNPWRFSFDRKTGDLWIGDVGQNAWEEIDFQPAASVGGENYGWNVFEATHTYPPNDPPPANGADFTMPVLEYDRTTGTSVTGGYVYRGGAQEKLWGTYLYADFSVGRVWGLQRGADGGVETRLLLDNDMMIASFGEDDGGELYLVDFNGGVHRVIAP